MGTSGLRGDGGRDRRKLKNEQFFDYIMKTLWYVIKLVSLLNVTRRALSDHASLNSCVLPVWAAAGVDGFPEKQFFSHNSETLWYFIKLVPLPTVTCWALSDGTSINSCALPVWAAVGGGDRFPEISFSPITRKRLRISPKFLFAQCNLPSSIWWH